MTMPDRPDDAEQIPDLGPVPTRIDVDEATVTAMITEQFPRWTGLPIRRVAVEGWDNRSFRLGADLLVRLPSAEAYALAVAKEQRWLPVLAPQLPLPIPEPVATGEPGAGYPYPWSVYRWLPGEPARRETITDLTAFAASLADFLAALRAVDPTDAPGPGLHNWYRGGTLRTYAANLADDLDTLAGVIDTEALAACWQEALAASWDGVPVWFHGDVAMGNLLVRDGALAAVIDFGTCGAGDPACDLAIAWTLLDRPGRALFRDRLGLDAGTWTRGRGWALWKAVANYAWAVRDADPDASESRRTLDALLAER